MILIADSGSTKTSWRLVDENKKILHFSTEGLNPYFKSQGEIVDEIKASPLVYFPDDKKVHQIFFYGAGCSSTEKCEMVKAALSQCFQGAEIMVSHDILAAARATCGHSEGIVCILGTGSNSCSYDGTNIIQKIGGLGYILGDEGSGSHIGKQLLEAYLNHELPEDLKKDFDNTFHLTKEEIDKRVYEKPQANRFLASFSRFIGQHKQHPFCIKTIEFCVEQFLEKHVCRYPDYKKKTVHFVGSIAYYYTDFLQSACKKHGITVGKILPYPVEELTLYHLAI